MAIVVALTSGTAFLQSAPYGVVGALLAIRRPRNSVGWLLLGGAWLFALSSLNIPASPSQLQTGAVSTLVMAVAVMQSTTGGPLVVLLFSITLVFPSGHLPTGRWRPVARLSLVLLIVLTVLSVFAPTISVTVPGTSSGVDVPNPLAMVPGWSAWTVLSAGSPILLVFALLGVASMVVRLRRAQAIERAQLRWLVWSMAFVVVGFVVGLVGDAVFANGLDGAVWVPALITFALPPIAIGVAVLRYRLYEIDRLVSRTIGYSLSTALLGAVFVTVILALQTFFGFFTKSSELAVAGSTLLVAALFQPVRRQVQLRVNRRFNRSRYDAERTVTAFVARIRDAVELEALETDMLATVRDTLEPTTSRLWLSEPDPLRVHE